MTLALEYHRFVNRSAQRSIPASLAVFGMLLLPLFSVCPSAAQINGTPPSVTSPGFGGHAINGTPPSVTSLGRNGFSQPNPGVTFSTNVPHPGHNGEHHRNHHSAYANSYYPYIYAVPVPYGVDATDANNEDDTEDDSDYQGGPTIFDRRGSGRDSYIPPVYPGPAHARAPRTAPQTPPQAEEPPVSADASPEQPQIATTLVFKDGHQIEVGNYAIVAQTLYDLTSGHPRKIALSDLDLSATQKENDDRGVVFQLPPSAQAN